VAEIGCGVGMLLFRIAPIVCAAPAYGHYLGTDVAAVALEHVKSVQTTFQRYKDISISTAQIAAHEISSVCAPLSQDVVLCNSVSQHFTGVSYLLRALQASAECVKPGGAVVFGDLLNRRYHLPLKVDVEVFHALRAPHNSITAASIWDRAKMKTTVDPNVFYDDSLFHRLERASDSLFCGRLARVDLRLKRGKWHSEFTRFRYDVELVLANDAFAPHDNDCCILKLQRIGVEAATRMLGLTKQDGQPYCGPAPGILEDWVYDLVTSLTDLTDGVVVTLPNARTVRPVYLARWIEMAAAQGLSLEAMPKWLWPVDASDVQGEFGVEPEALFELRLPTGWTSRVIFAVDPAMLELVLLRERAASTRWLSAVRDCGKGALSAVELAAMANGADSVAAVSASVERDKEESLQEWNKTLKGWVSQSSLLPVMRPQVYIPLDALPKNTAGKVDRGALPNALEAFDQLTGSVVIVPETDDEEKMAKCFERALKRDRVSVETAFHTYGGHSLTALTLRSEISNVFGVYLPASLFTHEHCTVRWLLKEMKALDNKDQREVDPKIASRFPLPVERTWSTFFHVAMWHRLYT
jgi:SAM-dependent methyltransferase